MTDSTRLWGLPIKAVYGLGGLMLLTGGAFALGLTQDFQRIWANLLLVSYFLLGLGLGSAVVLALLWVTGARWSDTIRPVVETMTYLLPAGAIGIAIVLFACPSLYPWNADDYSALGFQALWLDRPFFLMRAVGYLALWLAMAHFLVHASRRHEGAGSAPAGAAVTRISAIFLVVFSITFWLASTDWIMSLEPKWSSTIFGLYNFAGIFLGALSAIIVLVICFGQTDALRNDSTRAPLVDLGTLLFAFSSFWMYVWFSQYLLIWFVDNPEETEYFVLRQFEPWSPLFLANLVLNWGVPFVVLLFRPAKENPRILLGVALIVLAGRWLDLYLMILPPVSHGETVFTPWDIALVPGAIAAAAWILAAAWPRSLASVPERA
jgi:hypothetical protein